jgi:CRP-like cAMP-binding protein
VGEKIASAQKFALFEGFSPADSASIISSARETHFCRGQTLFGEGEPVEQVFLVLSGSVKITQVGFDGSEVILRVTGVGDPLGIFALWPVKHNSSAQIVQPGTALVWDSGHFAKLLDHFALLRRNAMCDLEQRLQEMEQRFREISIEDVPSRLSGELIRLSSRVGEGVIENREIHLSQTDFARLTGTTVSTVNRLLSRWQKLGIISIRRQAVRVHNHAALMQVSRGK